MNLLASLRDLDPTIELVHFGEGDWRLGAVRLTPQRVKAGAAILYQQEMIGAKASPKHILLGKLLQQGFAQIAQYQVPEGQDVEGTVICQTGKAETDYRCTILEDFRARDHAFRNDAERAFAARLDETNDEPARREQEARQAEYLRTDGRDHYRRIMRDRKVFGHGGTAAAASHIIIP
ncbi:MAG: hypothetical protein H0W63_03900 [Gemmatimonadaceae bacterium]|nr:hypothetical protein [Gemmatimonadaceae bacterium]